MVGFRRIESTLIFATAPLKTPLECAVLGACLLRVVLTSSSDSRYVNYHDCVVTKHPQTWWLRRTEVIYYIGLFLWVRNSKAAWLGALAWAPSGRDGAMSAGAAVPCRLDQGLRTHFPNGSLPLLSMCTALPECPHCLVPDFPQSKRS